MRWLPRWLSGPPHTAPGAPDCFEPSPPANPGLVVRALGALCYAVAVLTFVLCLLVMLFCLVSLAAGLFTG